MVTVGVTPSDSGEEEGREMKNRAATPPVFCFVFFLFTFLSVAPTPPPTPLLSERLEQVSTECLVSE